MAYTPQFGKATTLALVMSDSETSSATLSSAAFTNFVGDFLVLDYDVPAKREVIKCTVTGTAISSITRAQDGTSAVEHAAGAKVGYNFVPSHYGDLGKIAASDASTTWTPTYAGVSADPTTTANYLQIGKLVFVDLTISAPGTSNATTKTVTLPVNAKRASSYLIAQAQDNNVIGTAPAYATTAAGSNVLTLTKDISGAAWTGSGNWFVKFSFVYEAA